MNKSMFLALLLMYVQTAPLFSSQNELASQGMEYCISMLSTTAHELGHALTSKFFWGSPIDITIGSLPSAQPQSHIKIGWLKIAGLWPTGYAACRFPHRGANPIKAAATLLAGPICGIASYIVAHTLLNKYAPKYSITKNIIRYSLWMNILDLIPIRLNNNIKTDGYNIWQCMRAYYHKTLWRP